MMRNLDNLPELRAEVSIVAEEVLYLERRMHEGRSVSLPELTAQVKYLNDLRDRLATMEAAEEKGSGQPTRERSQADTDRLERYLANCEKTATDRAASAAQARRNGNKELAAYYTAKAAYYQAQAAKCRTWLGK